MCILAFVKAKSDAIKAKYKNVHKRKIVKTPNIMGATKSSKVKTLIREK